MALWEDLITLLRYGPQGVLAEPEHPGTPKRQWLVGLAGESHRNKDGSQRQEVIARCRVGERVLLLREPKNRRDGNAILVCRLDGKGLGYIPADQAVRLADEIDGGAKFNAYIHAINGGGFGRPHLGVVVRVCAMG